MDIVLNPTEIKGMTSLFPIEKSKLGPTFSLIFTEKLSETLELTMREHSQVALRATLSGVKGCY